MSLSFESNVEMSGLCENPLSGHYDYTIPLKTSQTLYFLGHPIVILFLFDSFVRIPS
jgi:hypothetical protein